MVSHERMWFLPHINECRNLSQVHSANAAMTTTIHLNEDSMRRHTVMPTIHHKSSIITNTIVRLLHQFHTSTYNSLNYRADIIIYSSNHSHLAIDTQSLISAVVLYGRAVICYVCCLKFLFKYLLNDKLFIVSMRPINYEH